MYNPNFSHIYVEEDAYSYETTKSILSKFKNAKVITIKHYKDIFNRHNQDWLAQKKSQKLILAKRRNNFIYEADNSITPDFGHKNYFYNALALNCIYDCHYCYLQGMYPSAHIVCFVNVEDYFLETKKKLDELKEMYLCISYDSDILAFENFLGYGKEWINFAKENPGLTIEIRTKSVNVKSILEEEATPNVILAWTLTPNALQAEFEEKTPSLDAKLNAIKKSLEKGFSVRICLDPLIYTDSFNDEYLEFIKELSLKIDLNKIRDLYIGCFRINKSFLKKMQDNRKSKLFITNWQEYQLKDNVYSYSLKKQEAMKSFVKKQLVNKGLSTNKILIM